VAGSVPKIDKVQTKPKTAAPDVKPSSMGEMSQIASQVVNWMELAIGAAVLLLAAMGFAWYRKGKAERQGPRHQLGIANDVHEDTESARSSASSIKSMPMAERTMKIPEMLEEADIYLRFGHDKLAEEALREAIRINPKNPQAYLTLSRICFSRKDGIAFLDLAKQLRSIGDENVWSKVVEMGRSLDPNNTLYS
jgi:hypothetical protein